MLLQHGPQALYVWFNVPHPHLPKNYDCIVRTQYCATDSLYLTLAAAADDLLSVIGNIDRTDPLVMSIMYDIHQFAGLRCEGPNRAVVPRAHYTLPIVVEANSGTREIRHAYSQHFLRCFRIPDPYSVLATSCEHRREVAERDQLIYTPNDLDLI